MKQLTFIKIDWDGSQETRNADMHVYYQIFNQKKQYLGMIKKIRVGAWMSWCFCPDFDDDIDLNNFCAGDVWFSASCLDEIREKIRELNAKSLKPNNQEHHASAEQSAP